MEGKVKDDGSNKGSGDSVPKKQLLMSPFSVSAKEMIVSLYRYLEKEGNKNQTSLLAKTAKLVGTEVALLEQILKEYEGVKLPVYSDTISASEESAIRKKFYSFFENDQIPSQKMLLKAVNEDENLPDFRRATFDKVMKRLRFQYLKKKTKNAVLDKNDLVVCRRNYLEKLIEYRKEGREIFYLDEACIRVEETAPKTASKKTSPEVIRLLNIIHIRNETGYQPDAAEITETQSKEPMTVEHFEGWFENVLSKLGENAVVVLDNAPYHSRRVNRIPNCLWPRVNIQEWMRAKGIEFAKNEMKVDLIEKINKLKLERVTYAVDEMAKKYKVEVLRIPPFHHELNPMGSMLTELKEVLKNKFSTVDEARMYLKEGIEKYPVEKWLLHLERAKEEEVYFYKIDDIIDDVMDRLYEDLTSEAESSDETDSNSDYTDLTSDTEGYPDETDSNSDDSDDE